MDACTSTPPLAAALATLSHSQQPSRKPDTPLGTLVRNDCVLNVRAGSLTGIEWLIGELWLQVNI